MAATRATWLRQARASRARVPSPQTSRPWSPSPRAPRSCPRGARRGSSRRSWSSTCGRGAAPARSRASAYLRVFFRPAQNGLLERQELWSLRWVFEKLCVVWSVTLGQTCRRCLIMLGVESTNLCPYTCRKPTNAFMLKIVLRHSFKFFKCESKERCFLWREGTISEYEYSPFQTL